MLPLLIPSPNNKQNTGQHRDKFVVDPSVSSTVQMEMLRFLGMMMGASIRSKVYMAISLPSLFWKKLSRLPVDKEDLMIVDKLAVKYLEDIANCTKSSVTPENFADYYDEHFTTFLSNGEEVELVPDGKTLPLTFHNRHEYCRLVLAKRLTESDKQINAIREGLTTVVPESIINIYSYSELEIAVCG